MRPADECDEHHQSTCLDTERSPNSTINHLPDEVLLDIFDFYRQGVDSYDHQWREKYVWFNLIHVSKRWRAVVFASPSRLDLSITVGPIKPDHIETILSSPLPVFIDYKCMYQDMTRSALWRMRSALEQRDRVRGISFEGSIDWFDEYFKATNCNFPILESLVLCCEYHKEVDLPDLFLGGPDLSNLHLRSLKLERVSLSSVSRFLLSTSSLTDLSLRIETAFGPSAETPLVACLQGLPHLSRLDLSISHKSPSPPSSPQRIIIPLSDLTCFRYVGHSVFLDALVAGISAPHIQDLSMEFFDAIFVPIVHLTRFINETEEHYHAVHVTFHREWVFRLSLLTQSEYFHYRKPASKASRVPRWSPGRIMRMSGALSAKLTTVTLLRVTFESSVMAAEDYILWRRFYQLFPNVKTLWIQATNHLDVAHTLFQDHEGPDDVLAFLPFLEVLQLGEGEFWTPGTEAESKLTTFLPFLSARELAGRPVQVLFRSVRPVAGESPVAISI